MNYNSSDPATMLKEHVINSDEFSETHFALKLMEFLEERVLDLVLDVLTDYMQNFYRQQDIWFGITLFATLVLWSSVSIFISRTLQHIYSNTVDILKIIPSNMISTNKVLLSRIFELSRKV